MVKHYTTGFPTRTIGANKMLDSKKFKPADGQKVIGLIRHISGNYGPKSLVYDYVNDVYYDVGKFFNTPMPYPDYWFPVASELEDQLV